MSSYKNALVKWYMGQTLLPDHFEAEEGALLSESRIRAQIQGLPAYGIAQLTLNADLLQKGTVSVHNLTAVLSTGVIVDVPGNCRITVFSMTATAATSRCSIYLHLLAEKTEAEGIPLYEDDSKYVQRVIAKAVISTQEAMENTLGTLKFGEFEKAADGTWSIYHRYIPALLQVGANPFLDHFITNLNRLLKSFRGQLEGQLKDTFFGPAKIASIRLCLTEVVHLQSQIDDIQFQVCRHPFYLFDAVRLFYLHLCCFQETTPDSESYPYNHQDLGGCFSKMLTSISDKLRPINSRSTSQPFVLQDGVYRVMPLAEAATASEVYVLVQRQSLHDRVSMDGVKLAAPSRLAQVHRLALKGVPFKQVSQPNFPHSFGPEIDFYPITTGEEWELAIREGSLAFYNQAGLDKARGVILFWRYY